MGQWLLAWYEKKERFVMKLKPPVYLIVLLLLLLGTAVWADQIILKDGTVYSGKFIRGDAKLIEFRILGRVESFKTTDISRLIFEDPEIGKSAGAAASNKVEQPSQPDKEDLTAAEERPRRQLKSPEPAAQDASASTITVPA